MNSRALRPIVKRTAKHVEWQMSCQRHTDSRDTTCDILGSTKYELQSTQLKLTTHGQSRFVCGEFLRSKIEIEDHLSPASQPRRSVC